MKGKYLPFLILPLFLFSFLLLNPLGVKAGGNPNHKIDICHATSADNNPYTSNNVDKNATAAGHGLHTGPVWTQGIIGVWGDIIPPYTYSVYEVVNFHYECPDKYSPSNLTCPGRCYKDSHPFTASKCTDKVKVDEYANVSHSFLGLNWTTEGQAILRNGCAIPYLTCSSTVRVFGDWSEWIGDPSDETLEYRERLASAVDSRDSQIVCVGPRTERETRYKECSRTVRSFTEWSDWSIDNENEAQEYRERQGYAVDSQNSEIICAGPVTIKEVREINIEYEDCSYSSEIYGIWSNWSIDLSDSTREFRQRIVNTVDSENSELQCAEPRTETEYRDIEEDEPSVLGESTKVEEVGVVLAETGSSSNVFTYVMQGALSLSTIVSGVVFFRKFVG